MGSLSRVAYRQMLKQGARASTLFPEIEDLCFVIFGTMFTIDQFTAAGYGTTFTSILRTCFDRPSVTGDPRDLVSERSKAVFPFLRMLHELSDASSRENVNRLRRVAFERSNHSDNGTQPLKDPAAVPTSEDRPGALHHSISVSWAEIYIAGCTKGKTVKSGRHVVFYDNAAFSFPPYFALLPPEPVYPMRNMRTYQLPLLNEAVIWTSALYQSPKRDTGKGAGGLGGTTGSHMTPSLFPSTVADIRDLLARVPTEARSRCPDHLSAHISCFHLGSIDADGQALGPGPWYEQQRGRKYVFKYSITITNETTGPVLWHGQILSQHLLFIDIGTGAVVDIVDPGVVGNAPIVPPGGSHRFVSGVTLESGEGFLRGTLQVNLVSEDGKTLFADIEIPPVRMSAKGPQPSQVTEERREGV